MKKALLTLSIICTLPMTLVHADWSDWWKAIPNFPEAASEEYRTQVSVFSGILNNIEAEKLHRLNVKSTVFFALCSATTLAGIYFCGTRFDGYPRYKYLLSLFKNVHKYSPEQFVELLKPIRITEILSPLFLGSLGMTICGIPHSLFYDQNALPALQEELCKQHHALTNIEKNEAEKRHLCELTERNKDLITKSSVA